MLMVSQPNKSCLSFRLGLFQSVVLLCLVILRGTEAAFGNTIGQDYRPYCGIECLYAALRYFDKTVEFDEMLRPEYLGSVHGSSLTELRRAALDHGLYAEVLTNLTVRDLRETKYPMILRVRGYPADQQYRHFLLHIGTADKAGGPLILDPSNPKGSIDYGQVVRIWEGTAIVISASPIDLGDVTHRSSESRYQLILAVAVTIIGLTLISVFLSPRIGFKHIALDIRQWPLLYVWHIMVLVGFSVAAALCYQTYGGNSYLRNPGLVNEIATNHSSTSWPTISSVELRNALSRHNTVLVDARWPNDYHRGHISGAINLPPSSTPQDVRRVFEGMNSGTELIVIYCQSMKCDYDDRLAGMLARSGYQNVKLLHDGWEGWLAGLHDVAGGGRVE